ncbi:hypothetical protein ACUTGB_26570, partial [Klebsiella pneumoniae]
IKNDGHYFCRAGGNRPDGLNEPVTNALMNTSLVQVPCIRSLMARGWVEVVASGSNNACP